MAHGTPDWGVTAGSVTTYQLTDLAELAARLGSPVTFDRRGDVIFMETFEEATLNKWQAALYGSGSSVTLSTLRARFGALSALLTAGPVADSRAALVYYSPYGVMSAFGLEAAISRNVIMKSLTFYIDLYDGVNVTSCALRWSFQGSELSYMKENGAWVSLGTVYLSTEPNVFHVFKLVVNGVSNEYARAVVNNQAFYLGGIAARVSASAILPVLFFDIDLRGDDGPESEVWVDNVIVTQNEPV